MEISIKWNLCRICLKAEKSELVSLFNDAKLAEQIQECTGKTVHEDDGMPNQICYDCIDELQTTYEFISKFNKSDEHIRSVVQRTMSTTSSLTNFSTSNEPLASSHDHDSNKSLLRSNLNRKPTNNVLNVTVPKLPKQNLNMRKIELKFNSEKESSKSDQSESDNCDIEYMTIQDDYSPEKDEKEEDVFDKEESEDDNTKKTDEIEIYTDEHDDQYINTSTIVTQEDTTSGSNDFIIILSNKNNSKCDESITEDELLSESIMNGIKQETNNKKIEKYHLQSIEELVDEDDYEPSEECSKINYKTEKDAVDHDRSNVIVNGLLEPKKHVEVKHVCPTCKNSFPRLSLLKSHLIVHQKIKKFQCELCLKKFGSSHNLANHMRIHTGEKPYECKYCDRRFGDRSSHLKHERIHTNERPFHCLTCGKSFALSTTLKAHEATHSNEKPFSCEICKKGFKLRHQLKAHLTTTAHKMAEEEVMDF